MDALPDHLITEEVREWDYGEYEGLKPAEIQAINPGWAIWKDGCPGGEGTADMAHRVDCVIEKVCPVQTLNNPVVLNTSEQVREKHRLWLEEGKGSRDVVIVAHGHFNRVFIARWVRFPLSLGKSYRCCASIGRY